MASSSSQTSFYTSDLVRLCCTRLNDDVYELYRPASGPISMQIVFFHGFQRRGCEDAFIRTWMTRDGSACWLNTWLVGSIPQAHILSVSYDSSTRTSDCEGRQDMYLIAENLAYNLVEVVGVGRDCPVVLVGHCVGGLVLKELCLKASQMMHDDGRGSPHHKFLDNLRGMFFYSTAQLGSHLPLTGNLIQEGPLLTYFKRLSTNSARINDEFGKLRRRYNWKTYGVSEANETRTAMLMLFFDRAILPGPDSAAASEYQLVVGEGSGRNDLDKFCVISDVDHFTICNPTDQYSNSFVYLINFLQQFREEEDESNRDLERRLQLDSNWICFEERISDVIELLDLKNPEPRRLAIVGMDGIGKSTLVKQILVRIQHQFDVACFLEFENVPHKQQWTDFEKLFAENLYRGSGKKVILGGEAPWSLLRRKKVLVVVDDVEAENQIRPLLNFNWCGEGSRLIITTCNKSLTPQYIKFNVPRLSGKEAAELFETHVESSLLQRISGELVSQIVDECDGLPLALHLVGRYLSRKSDELIWIGVLEMLRIRTTKALGGSGENEIWKWFKVIFYDLHLTEQKIFLDLATFDVYGRERNQYDLNILKVAWRTGLGSDGRLTDMAIENLRDKCLLQIGLGSRPRNIICVQTAMDVEFFSQVYIHKLLRNIGQWLSRLLNEEVDLPHGRGLWELEEIKDVLNVTKGEVAQRDRRRLEILSVVLEPNDSFLRSRKDIKWSSISRFEALRLLRMSNVNMTRGSDEFILPQSLAMLHLVDCSGPQPRRFSLWQPDWPIRVENVECLRRLSVLLLDNCNSIRLPENTHRLQNLRILQIHDSTKDSVMKLPEKFGFLPALEHLSLSAQVDKLPDSLLALSSLKSMKLSGCSILKEWPIAIPARVDPHNHLTCLTSLELSNLPALAHLPDTFGGLRSLKKLSLEQCSALEGLPEGFSALPQLTRLSIRRCERLERLCESFDRLSKLRHLTLAKLPALRMLPGNLGHLPSLEHFDIVKCSSLVKLPESFIDLHPLLHFEIIDCDSLESLWQDVPGHCGLSREPKRLQLSSLKVLRIEHGGNLQHLPDSLGELTSLRNLAIRDCVNLQHLPDSLGQLTSLQNLSIWNCRNLEHLPDSLGQLKSLQDLFITDCVHYGNLQHLPDPLGHLKTLQHTSITDFGHYHGNLQHLPDSLGQLTSLQYLNITDCSNLQHLPDSLGQLTSLQHLCIWKCGNLQHLPDSVGQLMSLRHLSIGYCENLQHMPDSFGQLTSLQDLTIVNCDNLQQLPDSLGQLTALQDLAIRYCVNLLHLPASLGQLTSLQYLTIVNCENLQYLPSSLGQLTLLHNLSIGYCENLQHLPDSLGQLTALQYLAIQYCENLQHLPDSLDHLTSLQQLAIRDCENLHLPLLRGLKIVHCGNLPDCWIY